MTTVVIPKIPVGLRSNFLVAVLVQNPRTRPLLGVRTCSIRVDEIIVLAPLHPR